MEGNTFPNQTFNLLGSIPLFNYLTTPSPRIQWYRTIMRVLLRFHREYRHYVTEQEIRDAVHELLDTEYRVEQCKEDLEYLRQYDNITTIYDTNRATSIAEFIHRPLLYQATPEALALENFLDSQIYIDTRTGALDQSNLPLVYQILTQLDKDLERIPREEHVLATQDIAEKWKRGFELWSTLAENAALYLRTIAEAAQHSGTDLEAYATYKKAVVQYVQRFAETLLLYGRDIRDLLLTWSLGGKKERLIALVAQHRYSVAPSIEGKEPLSGISEKVQYEFDILARWFAEGGNTDLFRRKASAEVEHVVRQASTLSLAGRASINYVTQLQTLARQLAQVKDVEVAQQLFSAAFAHTAATHFTETLFGPAEVASRMQVKGAWDSLPAAQPRLWSLGQRGRSEKIAEAPMPDQSKAIHLLRTASRQRDEEQLQRLASLFQEPLLDIGTLEHIDPEYRALLEDILDNCLMNAQSQYQGRDGALVTLLNRRETRRISLISPDGILRLPRYILQYQKSGG